MAGLPALLVAGVGPLPPEQPDRLFAPGLRVWAAFYEALTDAPSAGERIASADVPSLVPSQKFMLHLARAMHILAQAPASKQNRRDSDVEMVNALAANRGYRTVKSDRRAYRAAIRRLGLLRGGFGGWFWHFRRYLGS